MFVHSCVELEKLINAYRLGASVGGVREEAITFADSAIKLLLQYAVEVDEVGLEGFEENGQELSHEPLPGSISEGVPLEIELGVEEFDGLRG